MSRQRTPTIELGALPLVVRLHRLGSEYETDMYHADDQRYVVKLYTVDYERVKRHRRRLVRRISFASR